MGEDVTVVGAGLAGCEAAYQLKRFGFSVRLIEMKRRQRTPAQQSDRLAELVCSNSLRSQNPLNAVGLLKEEMRALGSLVMHAAQQAAVPAGDALAVDRNIFAEAVESLLLDDGQVGIDRRHRHRAADSRPHHHRHGAP